MTQPKYYLAFDLGAESGRAILGSIQEGCIHLEEVHRFANSPVRLIDGMHWDVLRLWSEIVTGLGKAAQACPGKLASVGIDTWGVDFALLDRNGSLIGNPFHYRDARTDGMLEEAFQRVPRETIFERTGIQFMQINTLYQLLSMARSNSPILQAASSFLTMPDLFNYWLCGRIACEETIATTTQCYDPVQRVWATDLIEAMGIPASIFPEVIQPGTVMGRLLQAVADEAGIPPIPVVAPACHDTGSAVVAIPAQKEGFAWISSGTWSIVGVETPDPVINADSLRYNLTNEGGVAGTWRLSKNVIGLWLVQECRRTWTKQGEAYSYDELTQLAEQARPFLAVIDTDAEDFLHPGDMPERLRAYCRRTGQAVPETKGEIIRVVLESLALRYRWVLECLEKTLGYELNPIHIFGGGSKNRLLNQFAANATHRQVVSGPVEATATGNILMQAVALDDIGSVAEARQVVSNSVHPELFEPQPATGWDEAYVLLMQKPGNL